YLVIHFDVHFSLPHVNANDFMFQRIIPLPEVTGVRRAKTAGLFPNAIEIIAGSRKHFFASFLSRDDAFKIINDGWLRRCNGSTIITEQQESISELSSQENGFIAIENVKSAEILDKESLFSELSKDTSICKDVGLPSHVGDDPELMTAPEKQSSMIQVAKPVLNNDAPSVSWNWKEDDIDAPTNFVCSSWHPQEKFGHLVIETVQDVTDVLYSDYFRVEGLWDIERDKDESKECCILRVYVNVAFLKKTIWKESSAIAVVTQNDNINFHREGKTEESSEASIEQINPTTIQTTSNVSDATHNVNSSLQGNFIDTTSIPSLFKEFMTKFRLSLKNQSNLSMLLVTIFTLIFFMQQFSILMLLARPQQIHVSTGADYMNKMGSGMTRNPSDIAWMEKRIHHLKDEMYMVETRLERMRYEHALLKNQLKDLDLK
ncbi:hypothetical protein TanjilG_25263, partial [Lupinus angustifolius]